MSLLRLGIYIDFVYRTDDQGVSGEHAVARFAAELGPRVGEAVLFGRLHPEPGREPYPLPDAGVRFVALPHYPSVSAIGPLVRAAARSCRIFASEVGKLDAVWLFGPHPLSLAFTAIARARGVPVFHGIRQDLPAYIGMRLPNRRWLWALGAAYALDRTYRALGRWIPTMVVGEDLAAKFGARRRASVIPIGISLTGDDDVLTVEHETARTWDGELRLLSVGRLDPEKNPLLLADILALLRSRDPRWALEVAGDGPMREAVREHAAELGVGDHLRLAGHVQNGPRLNELYRTAHAFLHVSFTEGLPQVLFEANAAALPIVATDVGGVGAALDGGAAGLLIPPADAEQAARAVERLRDEPALRRRLVERGLALARRSTMEHSHERIVAFIGERLGSAPAQQAAQGPPGELRERVGHPEPLAARPQDAQGGGSAEGDRQP